MGIEYRRLRRVICILGYGHMSLPIIYACLLWQSLPVIGKSYSHLQHGW